MDLPFIIGIVLILHFFSAMGTQQLIFKSRYLTRSQKLINSFLIWLIPFFWGMILRFMIRESDVKVMTKAHRKTSTSPGDPGSIGAGDSYGGGGSDGGGDSI